VRRGRGLGARIFPDRRFTVPDWSQVTRRRINFRQGSDYPSIGGVVQPSCTSADYSICDGFAALNKLDGFDLQPRVAVPFTGAIDLDSVNASNFYIGTSTGAFVTGSASLPSTRRRTSCPESATASSEESTSYRICVTNGILDGTGQPIRAFARPCRVRFTTRTASGELVASASRWTFRSPTAPTRTCWRDFRTHRRRPPAARSRSRRTAWTTSSWPRASRRRWPIRSTESSAPTR
jgi:hypothetical protein